MKAVFKTAKPYQGDVMELPIGSLEEAIPFYESVMGFRIISRHEAPHRSAALGRDGVKIGLTENGGNPAQNGCFFAVDDVEAAFAELRANGLGRNEAGFREQRYGDASYRVFFVIAPDGLCYCLGERLG